MTDEPMDDGASEGPRRKTYEPPSEEAVFTGSFPVIDDSPETAAAADPDAIPDPPVRSSLPEAAILTKFRDPSAGSTSDMIAELEKQVLLKEREEELFEQWAQVVRDVRGPDAEAFIARERIIFDGGDPGPLEQETEQETLDELSEGLDSDVAPESPNSGGSEMEDSGEPEHALEGEPSPEEIAREDTVTEVASAGVDEWPLTQAESPEGEPAVPAHAQPLLGALASWWGIGLPLAAVLSAGYLSFRGLGVVESWVVLGSLALLSAVMVGVLSHQGFRRGLGTQELVQGTFGRRGALAPALLIGLFQLATVVFLLWWASTVLVEIIGGAGLWPYENWIALAGAFAVVVGVVAALTLIGPRVLWGALAGGSLASIVALVVVVIRALPSFEVSVSTAWSAEWMTVVSAASFLLSAITIVVVFVAADVATVLRSSTSRAGGVVSALALTLPFLALAGVAAWWAQSSPLVSLGLLANPVGTITEGAPAFYPIIAVLGAVLPLVVVAALLTRSVSLVAPSLPMPGHNRVHIAVVIGGVAVAGGLVVAFGVDLADVASDVAVTLGVVAVALAAILTKEWAVLGSSKPATTASVRVVPLVALLVPVAVGLGLVESRVSWLAWQGYLFPVLEWAGLMDLSPAQPGVLVSFVLAGVISGSGAMVQWFRSRKSADAE